MVPDLVAATVIVQQAVTGAHSEVSECRDGELEAGVERGQVERGCGGKIAKNWNLTGFRR